MNKKQIQPIIILSIFILIGFAQFMNDEVNAQMGLNTFSSTSYGYNPATQTMTDTNGMTYKTETNGVLTVNDERYLAFALKGTVGATEYTYTSMDFSWTWHMENNSGDYVFWAENDNPNFIWRQYYYFYQNSSQQMKIKHYLKNELADITNMQMYYLLTVSDDDIIERSMTEHRVGDVKPFHVAKNLRSEISIVNFNDMFDFSFGDLVETGFTINEYYIGSGSVIDKPSIDIMAIGFTKNGGFFPKGSEVWVDPTFSTDSVQSVAISPLDNETIVVAWADNTNGYRTFAIYDLNNTLKVGPINVDEDAGSGSYTSIAVRALNSTHFVVGWFDNTEDDISFKIYDYLGNNITGVIDADDSVGSSYAVSVSALNETTFVIGWDNIISQKATFRIYDTSGTPITDKIEPGSGNSNAVSVSAFNSTHFVIGWLFGGWGDVQFRIYNHTGGAVTGVFTVDNYAGNGHSVSVSTFNSTDFVICWFDLYSVDDNICRVYNHTGGAITAPIIVDSSVCANSAISVDTMNSTHFGVSWADRCDQKVKYRIYKHSGSAVTGELNVGQNVDRYQDISSYDAATGIGIYDNNFVLGWVYSTSVAVWALYDGDDGSLLSSDEDPPMYSDNSTNSTIAGTDILHSLKWADVFGIATTGGYIFSFDNGTETFTNDTWSVFSSNPDWSNTTRTVNTTVGTTIQWKVYANDTSDNWATSSTYSYITTTSDSCTPPAINNDWTITDVCEKDNENIELGTGSLIINATAGGRLILINDANVYANDFQQVGSGEHLHIFSGNIII